MNSNRSILRPLAPEDKARMQARLEVMRAEREARTALLPSIRADGEAALRRLLPIAQSDTGQSGVVARFLLNLYNGDRFPFDNTDLRRLDSDLVDDCLAVLRMDANPAREVHKYFHNGDEIWEQLARDWAVKDHYGASWR